MFALPTTFVIGAGASCELNLPSGDALMREIDQLLAASQDNMYGFSSKRLVGEIQRFLPVSPLPQQETIHQLARAGEVIRNALPWSLSIDNLLHNHQDDEWVERLGKAAIARCILDAEARSHFFPKASRSDAFARAYGEKRPPKRAASIRGEKLQQSWYKPFAQILFSQVRWPALPDALRNLRFVIFNYDRCFEQFLFDAIQEHYNVGPEKAAESLEHTQFVHPYGTLGQLPWQMISDSDPLPLGDSAEYRSAFTIGTNLRTFTESVESHIVESVRQCVRNGSVLIFLGFGFLKQNIDLMRTARGYATQIYATAYGLSEPNKEAAMATLNHFKENLTVPETSLEPGSCVDLLGNYRMKLSG